MLHKILGSSPQAQFLQKMVQQAAVTEAPVLISGERGTGREFVAAVLHERSGRHGRFEKLNCSGFSEPLIESEIARRMSRADGGTLFLDDVNEIPPRTQAELLRYMEDRSFGSVSADVRIITACARNLEGCVHEGKFNPELYERLLGIRISLPTLRDRKLDIPILVDHFLKKYADEFGKPIQNVHASAMTKLIDYEWPGNIRELNNAIERAVILATGDTLELRDFAFLTLKEGERAFQIMVPGATIQEVEKEVIIRTLEHVGGSTSLAAKMLNMSVRKIQYKLKEYRKGDAAVEVSVKAASGA
jgi:DNA-binding NtrC family response regulator